MLFILLAINITYAEPTQDEYVYIYYKSRTVQKLTIDQFEALIKAADHHNKILKAEQKGNISIVLTDNPFILEDGQVFVTKASIIWMDDSKKVLKTITIDLQLTKKKTSNNFILAIQKIYTQVAKWGFPVLVIILLIILI